MTAKKLTAQIKALERAQSALRRGAEQTVTELHKERAKCDLLALALEKALKGISRLTEEDRTKMKYMIAEHKRVRGYKT